MDFVYLLLNNTTFQFVGVATSVTITLAAAIFLYGIIGLALTIGMLLIIINTLYVTNTESYFQIYSGALFLASYTLFLSAAMLFVSAWMYKKRKTPDFKDCSQKSILTYSFCIFLAATIALTGTWSFIYSRLESFSGIKNTAHSVGHNT